MAKTRTTLSKRNGVKFAKGALETIKYGAPATPLVVMTAINWEDWFKIEDKFSVASGFIMLIASTLITYFSIAKKKKLLEGYSAFWSVAIIIICWGTSLLFLSSIIKDLGMVLLYVGFGIIASATSDEVETRLVQPKLDFYNGLVSENGLDKKEEKKRLKLENAKKQAEIEAQREAVE